MTWRVQQINQLLKEELSNILLRGLDFPDGVLVTVTRAEASEDLRTAIIFVSVMPEKEYPAVFRSLKKSIYNFQQQLNKRLKMRPVPKIIFREERATVEAGAIEELLEKIKQTDIAGQKKKKGE